MEIYLVIQDYLSLITRIDVWLYKPLKNECKRSYGDGSKSMTINHKNIVTHALVEGNLSNNGHASITKL